VPSILGQPTIAPPKATNIFADEYAAFRHLDAAFEELASGREDAEVK
jgi:hypothetical protein